MKRRATLYHLDRRPMYYGCAGTTMAALQYYNPVLADPLAYYASLLSWTFFFDKERGMPLKIPASQLMQRNLQHLYGIIQDEIREDRFDDLWLAIENLLEQGRVVVVWVDANHINDSAFHYNRVPGEVELMVICDCDYSNDTLDIIVNPQRFHGSIPLSCLSDILMFNLAYDYRVPERLVPWPASQGKQLLQADILGMLHGGTRGMVETGFSALRLFIKEMKSHAGSSDDVLRPWMHEAFKQLAFTGPQRTVFGQTLERLADLYCAPKLAPSAQRFLAIAQSWEVARNMFFKGCKRGPATMLPRILKRVEALLVEEQEQAYMLQTWLQKSPNQCQQQNPLDTNLRNTCCG